MRAKGTLTKWNDDRGFGFITPSGGGAEVFVHISAFPRDGQRPHLNEALTYEISPGKDGRTRAVGVARPGDLERPRAAHSGAPRPSRDRSHRRPASPPRFALLGGALALFAVAYGFQQYTARTSGDEADGSVNLQQLLSQDDQSEPQFQCDGRTDCSQMTSCEEAHYFLATCPGVKMDGDGDGVPCERQWCGD